MKNELKFFAFWTPAFAAYLSAFNRHVGPEVIAPALGAALALHIYCYLHSQWLFLQYKLQQRKNPQTWQPKRTGTITKKATSSKVSPASAPVRSRYLRFKDALARLFAL